MRHKWYSAANLLLPNLQELYASYYNNIINSYDKIFTGMTHEDEKAKKWIDKFMKKINVH